MRSFIYLMLSSIALCAAGPAVAVQMADGADAGEVGSFESVAAITDAEAHQCGGVSLSQAVAQVRRQYNGQIVSAETRVSGNCETHIIKVLTPDGKVKTVRVAGRSRN